MHQHPEGLQREAVLPTSRFVARDLQEPIRDCCQLLPFPGVAGFLKSAQPSRHRHPKPTFFNENHRIKWSYSRAGTRYGWSSGTKTKQACPIRIGQSRKPSAARRPPKPKVSAGIWLQHVCRLVPWTYAKFSIKIRGAHSAVQL